MVKNISDVILSPELFSSTKQGVRVSLADLDDLEGWIRVAVTGSSEENVLAPDEGQEMKRLLIMRNGEGISFRATYNDGRTREATLEDIRKYYGE